PALAVSPSFLHGAWPAALVLESSRPALAPMSYCVAVLGSASVQDLHLSQSLSIRAPHRSISEQYCDQARYVLERLTHGHPLAGLHTLLAHLVCCVSHELNRRHPIIFARPVARSSRSRISALHLPPRLCFLGWVYPLFAVLLGGPAVLLRSV